MHSVFVQSSHQTHSHVPLQIVCECSLSPKNLQTWPLWFCYLPIPPLNLPVASLHCSEGLHICMPYKNLYLMLKECHLCLMTQFIQRNSLFSLSLDTNYILLVVLLFPQWWESLTGTSGS